MVQSKSNDANFTLLTEHSLLPIYEYQMRSQLNLLCNAKVEFKSYVWDDSKLSKGAGSDLDKVEKEDIR